MPSATSVGRRGDPGATPRINAMIFLKRCAFAGHTVLFPPAVCFACLIAFRRSLRAWFLRTRLSAAIPTLSALFAAAASCFARARSLASCRAASARLARTRSMMRRFLPGFVLFPSFSPITFPAPSPPPTPSPSSPATALPFGPRGSTTLVTRHGSADPGHAARLRARTAAPVSAVAAYCSRAAASAGPAK